jgi:hypothetical protein
MTVENPSRTQLTLDLGEELEARRRLLLAELSRVESALKAYRNASINDFWSGLQLDDLTVKEALVAALEFAEKAGKEDVTLGDLENLLTRYRLRTSRRSGGKMANEAKSMHMLIVRILTAPGNDETFNYQRQGNNASRGDRVGLTKKIKR